MGAFEVLDSLPFLEIVVTVSIVVSSWHWYLDTRQLKAIKLPSPPPELAEVFNDDMYKKTQAYSLDKWWYGMYHGIFSFAENLVVLWVGALPTLWHHSSSLLDQLPEVVRQRLLGPAISQSASELGGRREIVGSSMVLELPWSAYSTFVIEQRHGFNKQTPGLFVSDFIKTILLAVCFVPPITAAFTYIIQISGPMVAIYLWGFMLALSLFLMTIYPVVIAPLFNKFESLQEGSLRSKIEELAGRLQFPLRKLFKIDGSKRSSHSKYDTLINHCSEEQVVAVLAHELGHWKLGHTPFLFAMGQAILLLQFSLFAFIRSSSGMFVSFGFAEGVQPALMAFVLFSMISSPLDEVISLFQNVVSRRFEFQADGFATGLGLGKDLRQALLKLEEENKSAMNVDPWYSSYHYSHPPLVERLKAIGGMEKKDS
eukprot:gene14243-20215_t